MLVRCRFCGAKIKKDTVVCAHCGKTLVIESDSSGSTVGRDSWEQKTVPAWVMYLVIAIGIGLLALYFADSFREPPAKQPGGQQQNSQ